MRGMILPLPARKMASVTTQIKTPRLPHQICGMAALAGLLPKTRCRSRIGEGRGQPLVFEDAGLKKMMDQHRKGGVKKKDQPFQPGGHVLQSVKAKQTAAIITQ